jgi:lysophospholipase L1-like esterase
VQAYADATYGLTYATRKSLIVCAGDSLTAGVGCQGQSYPLLLGGLMGNSWEVYNYGVSGQQLATAIGASGDVLAVPLASVRGSTKNVAVLWEGTNDIFLGSRTAAQVWADMQTWCALRRAEGFKTVVLTTIARGAGNSNVATLNTLIRGTNDGSVYDKLADVASLSQFSSSSNTTYYQADQVHLTPAGYAIIASTVQSSINAITFPAVSSGKGIHPGGHL